MIKINLLEVEKERKTRKTGGGPAVPGGPAPTGILAIGIIGLGIAALAFQFVRYNGKLNDMTTDVQRMRAKKAELEPYIKKVDELEAKRDELKKKNEAIQQLRSQRTIPVHIMDEVSRALPDNLWIGSLVVKGSMLTIDGTTLQEQAISTFMKSLEASAFIGPCNLVVSKQTGSASGGATQVTGYTISAPITNPFAPKVEDSASTTTTKKKK